MAMVIAADKRPVDKGGWHIILSSPLSQIVVRDRLALYPQALAVR